MITWTESPACAADCAQPPTRPSGADLNMLFKAADWILNDARCTAADRDAALAELSPHDQPGPYVEHAVEAHRLWAEALPDEATADAARKHLDEAIRELIGGAR